MPRRSYEAHHAERVAAIAAIDSRIQFEMDTTGAEGRQVMLQRISGAASTTVPPPPRASRLTCGMLAEMLRP